MLRPATTRNDIRLLKLERRRSATPTLTVPASNSTVTAVFGGVERRRRGAEAGRWRAAPESPTSLQDHHFY